MRLLTMRVMAGQRTAVLGSCEPEVTRKPVRVFDQVRFKPACAATEAS